MRTISCLAMILIFFTACGDDNGNDGTCDVVVPAGVVLDAYPELNITGQSIDTFFAETQKVPLDVPFRYRLDASVPEEYHQAFAAGIDSWNPLFADRIGFDLFQSDTSNADLEVTAEMIPGESIHIAAFTNPPGEMHFYIPADPSPLADRMRRYHRYFSSLMPHFQLDVNSMTDAELIELLLVAMVAHETGHVLGLGHNMLASADEANFDGACYSSLMDYGLPPFISTEPGPFDRAAIALRYFQENPVGNFLHSNGMEDQFNIFARIHDLGPDPLVFYEKMLAGLFEDWQDRSGWSLMDNMAYTGDLESATAAMWWLVSDANPDEEYARAAWKAFRVYLESAGYNQTELLFSPRLVEEVSMSAGYTRLGEFLAAELNDVQELRNQRSCDSSAPYVDQIVAILD